MDVPFLIRGQAALGRSLPNLEGGCGRPSLMWLVFSKWITVSAWFPLKYIFIYFKKHLVLAKGFSSLYNQRCAPRYFILGPPNSKLFELIQLSHHRFLHTTTTCARYHALRRLVRTTENRTRLIVTDGGRAGIPSAYSATCSHTGPTGSCYLGITAFLSCLIDLTMLVKITLSDQNQAPTLTKLILKYLISKHSQLLHQKRRRLLLYILGRQLH